MPQAAPHLGSCCPHWLPTGQSHCTQPACWQRGNLGDRQGEESFSASSQELLGVLKCGHVPVCPRSPRQASSLPSHSNMPVHQLWVLSISCYPIGSPLGGQESLWDQTHKGAPGTARSHEYPCGPHSHEAFLGRSSSSPFCLPPPIIFAGSDLCTAPQQAGPNER